MKENEALKKDKGVIPTVIPLVTTVVPSTLAEHLAPKGKLTTAVSISSKYVSAAAYSNTQVQIGIETGATDLVKAMEEMNLKNDEIKNLKKKIKTWNQPIKML